MRSVLASLAFFLGAWFAVACSKSDAGASGMDAASDQAPATDPCDVDAFIASGGHGHSCFPVTTSVCFPMCAQGGCVCTRVPGATDHGIWKCTTDTSCLPDGGPFDDTGLPDAAQDAPDAG